MWGVFITALKKLKYKNMTKVIKFYGEWCQPCKVLAPIFNQVKSEINDVSYQDVDIDKNPDLAIHYKVRGVPTIVIEKDGKEVKRIVGVSNKESLISLINLFK